MNMKIITWNVNGLRSVINKGFNKIIEDLNADIICIQETKITSEMKVISFFNNCVSNNGTTSLIVNRSFGC